MRAPPESDVLFNMPKFSNGFLTVEAPSTQGVTSSTIYHQGPGMVRRVRYHGPKDWSPHGGVPKQWIFLLKLPTQAGIIKLFATYFNVSSQGLILGGATYQDEISVWSNRLNALYFVPAVPAVPMRKT